MANISSFYPRNVLTSWLSLGVRMALVFLINPVIIHSLGQELYGVWALIFSLINYLTVFDLGMQQGLIRHISKYLSLNEQNKINSILSTSFLIFAGLAIAALSMSFVIAFGVLKYFNIADTFISEARTVLIIIGLNTAVNFFMLPWSGTLGAFHRFDLANWIAIGEDIGRSVMVIVVLKAGHGIEILAAVYLIFTILRVAFSAVALKKIQPSVKFSFASVKGESYRDLFDYSKIAFLISLIWLFIANLDNVIIGYFLDSTSVALFAAASILIVALRNLIHGIAIPLRPIVSHLDAAGETEKIKEIYLTGVRYLHFLTFFVAGAALAFADPFFALWLGESFQSSGEIFIILVIPAAFFFPHAVTESLLFATDRHKELLKILVVEALLKISFSLILLKYLGLLGVAYGTALSQIIVYFLILPSSINRLFGLKLTVYYRSVLSSSLPAFLVSAGVARLVVILLPPQNWGVLFAEILGLLALLLIAAKLLTGKPPQKLLADLFPDDIR